MQEANKDANQEQNDIEQDLNPLHTKWTFTREERAKLKSQGKINMINDFLISWCAHSSYRARGKLEKHEKSVSAQWLDYANSWNMHS